MHDQHIPVVCSCLCKAHKRCHIGALRASEHVVKGNHPYLVICVDDILISFFCLKVFPMLRMNVLDKFFCFMFKRCHVVQQASRDGNASKSHVPAV